MADTFVEERRVALERYMSTLAVHPVLSRSEELALFLSVEVGVGSTCMAEWCGSPDRAKWCESWQGCMQRMAGWQAAGCKGQGRAAVTSMPCYLLLVISNLWVPCLPLLNLHST